MFATPPIVTAKDLKKLHCSTKNIYMFISNSVSWEKLDLELGQMALDGPASILPVLIAINAYSKDQDVSSEVMKKLNHLTYELSVNCEGLSESERLVQLNDYFFNRWNFQISLENNNPLHWDYNHILRESSGSALSLSILYIYFAEYIDIPIHMINHPKLSLIKWIRPKNSKYIDLINSGKLLKQNDILELLKNTMSYEFNIDDFLEEIKPLKIMQTYLNNILKLHIIHNNTAAANSVLNVLLKLFPSDIVYLKQRALIRKSLGLTNEAMADLKSYFSFVENKFADKDLKLAYYELIALNTSEDSSVLH